LAKKLDQSSVKAGEHIERVEKSVAKEADAKFKAVREKIGITDDNAGPEIPPDKLVATVRNIEEKTLNNVPEHIRSSGPSIATAKRLPRDCGRVSRRLLGRNHLAGCRLHGTNSSPSRVALTLAYAILAA